MSSSSVKQSDGDPAVLELGQIKSRERVRDLAEVYTHEREVVAMLDLIPAMLPSETNPGNTDRSSLSPLAATAIFSSRFSPASSAT